MAANVKTRQTLKNGQIIRRTLAGKVIRAQTSASAPPTAMPTKRKGNNISQINGKSTKPIKARGQQRKKRISHSTNVIIV
jgi:hypothetical protein